MAQYIDKDAVVEKINNWIQDVKRKYTISKVQFSLKDRIESLENLLSFLDTLETKKVDLEKENIDLEKEVDQYFEKTWPFEEDDEDIIAFARYFYRLGLNAQKGK